MELASTVCYISAEVQSILAQQMFSINQEIKNQYQVIHRTIQVILDELVILVFLWVLVVILYLGCIVPLAHASGIHV